MPTVSEVLGPAHFFSRSSARRTYLGSCSGLVLKPFLGPAHDPGVVRTTDLRPGYPATTRLSKFLVRSLTPRSRSRHANLGYSATKLKPFLRSAPFSHAVLLRTCAGNYRRPLELFRDFRFRSPHSVVVLMMSALRVARSHRLGDTFKIFGSAPPTSEVVLMRSALRVARSHRFGDT